jgi:hypothetical protein
MGRSKFRTTIKMAAQDQDHGKRAGIEQTSADARRPKIAWSARSPRSEDLKDGCAARDLNPEPAD